MHTTALDFNIILLLEEEQTMYCSGDFVADAITCHDRVCLEPVKDIHMILILYADNNCMDLENIARHDVMTNVVTYQCMIYYYMT